MMKTTVALCGIALFIGGLALGAGFAPHWRPAIVPAVQAQDTARRPGNDLAAMEADIARLKEMTPSQSHSMTDVGYQFANMWFAGKDKNWPLAEFFLNETRQHIRWTIRIRPIRKSPEGYDVDLKGIYDSIDSGVMTKLKESIDKKDGAQFAATYKETLVACYSCHKASGKPFLRPMVPTAPPQTIINFDPSAKWPE